ncbi:hypothetical protein Tco_1346566 [Tanacetum coccineum]
MVSARTTLTDFSGEIIWPLGQLRLLVTIGDMDHCAKAWMVFIIVRSILSYNSIIGRPGIREIQAVSSTAHGMLKCPADGTYKTMHTLEEKPRYISVAAIGHDRSTAINSRTSAQYPGRILACLTEEKGSGPEHAKAIQAEVQKLVAAGIMREVYYHDWLSNPVMVKKHDGSWRMCVDFTDLNKACPQDCYPLPEIDWKIESLCGYLFKCFLDGYKGYHQI